MATSTLEDEIWDRLNSAKDLSKADIAFLLKCRKENQRLKEKVAKVSDELDRIKLIIEHVHETSEDSLRTLLKSNPGAGSALSSRIFRYTVLLKAMKMSLELCANRMAHKVMSHPTKNPSTSFYNIIKEGYKAEDSSFDKDIERLAQLSTWVSQRVENPFVTVPLPRLRSTMAPKSGYIRPKPEVKSLSKSMIISAIGSQKSTEAQAEQRSLFDVEELDYYRCDCM